MTYIRIEHKRQKQRIIDVLQIDEKEDKVVNRLKMMLGGDEKHDECN
jgi:Trp operon repressor